MGNELKNDVEGLAGRIVSWRRELHRHPEVAHDERRTSAFIRRHFKMLGIPARSIAGTGLRAVLRGRPGGKTVALRTDMDALPLKEETGLPFASLNDGAAADFAYEDGYPPVVNDPAAADFVLDVAKRALGEESVAALDPVMGGEDFAYYLQEVPGAFLFFGAGDGMAYPHHHPAFNFDERALAPASFLMTSLALEFLA